MQNNMQFSSVAYKGGANINGKPVYGQGRVVESVGGIFSTSSLNDTYEAVFGVVVSATPAAPNEFLIGAGAPSGLAVGVVQFDASIAQNDPAKPGYYLKGTPITVQKRGGMIIESWTKTASGAIDPVLGALPIYNNTTGVIEFIASGSAPGGWTLLPGKVFQINQDGFQGIELSLSF